MKRYVAMSVLLVAAVAASGCVVRESKYQAALAESEAAKTDLEKARAQKGALEQQVKSLRDANAKMSADGEFMSAELQRIKDSREKERASIDSRTKELELKVKDLSAQHRALRQEYEDIKKHNDTLKATVARYQKELKERERTIVLPSQPTAPRAPAAPTPPPPPSGSAPKPPETPSASQSDIPSGSSPSAMAPVNINTASAT